MFDFKNTFISLIIENEKRKIENHDIVQKIIEKGLVENISIIMNDRELYNDSVAKWFFRLIDTFDAVQKIQIVIQRYRFTRKGLSTTYSKLLKSLNDYNIYLASYHDLLLHFIVAVIKIEIVHKNITWSKIKFNCSDKIQAIMNNIYILLQDEIKFRNSSLHDFDYRWIEQYFSYDTVRFINIMGFTELKEILIPLQGPLVVNANLELSQIKEEINTKLQKLESMTYDLLNELMFFYER